jgi:tellurite resistance protein TerC
VERFHLLRYSLAAVLVFVGLKMLWLNDAFGGELPIGWSLGIICGALVLSILASIFSSFPSGPDRILRKLVGEVAA